MKPVKNTTQSQFNFEVGDTIRHGGIIVTVTGLKESDYKCRECTVDHICIVGIKKYSRNPEIFCSCLHSSFLRWEVLQPDGTWK